MLNKKYYKFSLYASLIIFIAYPLYSQNITINLEFSTDGGMTFSSQSPVVIEKPQEIFVKVNWEIKESRQIKICSARKYGIVYNLLYSTQTDFASAITGFQEWGEKGWYQRAEKHYFSAKKDRTWTYKLDLRERKEGTIGKENKWDPDKKQFVDAPLPSCPALKPGVYKFTVLVYYYIEGTNEHVSQSADFFVKITGESTDKSPFDEKIENQKKLLEGNPDNYSIPKIENYIYRIDTDKIRIIAGDEKLWRDEIFVKPTTGQEIIWDISEVKPDYYYLQILTETGTTSGEEELGGTPFVYLNGKTIPFDRAGEIVPYKDKFIAIIQSREPVYITPDNELRWSHRKPNRLVGTLYLSKEKMSQPPVWIREPIFPIHTKDIAMDDFIRIKDMSFKIPSPPEKKSSFSFSVTNVKGKPESFKINTLILDYFQNEIVSSGEDVFLGNRETFKKQIEFTQGNSDRYRAIIKVTDSEGNTEKDTIEVLTSKFEGIRRKLWMNDNWEWTSVQDDGTINTRIIGRPADFTGKEKWHKVDLPASWQDHSDYKNHHIAWYRKHFVFPEFMHNKRYFIHFSRVAYECKIYINKQEAGYYFGRTGPFELEITRFLKTDEENEILIGIRDGIACLKDEELSKYDIKIAPRANFKTLEPALKPGIGEVWIYSTGDHRIEDIFVKTSYRNKKIAVEITLEADGKEYLIENRVFLKGKEVLTMPKVKLKTDVKQVALVEKAWENPILWGPENFPLLKLQTVLKNPQGQIVDEVETRFGFRELWAEGNYLYWNGTKVKMVAAPFTSTWGWNLTERSKRNFIRRNYDLLAQKLGIRMYRHIYDAEYRADIADEEGIIFAQGSGGLDWDARLTIDVKPEGYFEDAARYAAEMVKGMRNHPSIVTWYLSNEFMGQSYPKNRAGLQKVGDAVLKIDDTRIIEFGSDLDLHGSSPIVSTHYPVEPYVFEDSNACFPEAAYWRYFKDKFTPGMKVPSGQIKKVGNVLGESQITWGDKPIVINETCWIVPYRSPDGLSKIFSDHVYESPYAIEKAHKLAINWFAKGHRDVEVSVITPWMWIHQMPALEIPPVDINILQKYNVFFGNTEISYDVNLHRDFFNSAECIFKWELQETNKILKSYTENIHFQSCDLKRKQIRFLLPQVREKTQLNLIIEMLQGNKSLKKVNLPIIVYPDIKLSSLPDNTVIFDADGDTYTTIKSWYPDIKRITEITPDKLDGVKLLIIGKNQADKQLAGFEKILLNYVRGGGRILVLVQQQSSVSLPLDIVTTGLKSSILYSFRENHPVLQDIPEEYLKFWYPDHIIAYNLYSKPRNRNFKSIVEAGGINGLVYSALLEIPEKKGLFLLSQIELLENISKSPVAALLWNNIVDYLKETQDSLQSAGFYYSGEKSNSVKSVLDNIGAKYKIIENDKDIWKYKTIIMDADYTISSSQVINLVEWIVKGGKLLIKNVTPGNRKNIEVITGPIYIYPVTPPAWLGRAVKIEKHPVIDGLTNFDLFWRKKPEPDFYSDKNILDRLGRWMIKPKDGKFLLYPSFISIIEKGKGIIVIDNLNYEVVDEVREHSERMLSTILTNLEIEIEKKQETTIDGKEMPDLSNITENKETDTKTKKADTKVNGFYEKVEELLADKKFTEAENLLLKIIETNPKEEIAYIKLGHFYESRGNIEKAVEIYEKMLQYNPDNLGGYYWLGQNLEKLGNFERAKQVYKKSLEINWNQPPVIEALKKLEERQK